MERDDGYACSTMPRKGQVRVLQGATIKLPLRSGPLDPGSKELAASLSRKTYTRDPKVVRFHGRVSEMSNEIEVPKHVLHSRLQDIDDDPSPRRGGI